METGCLQHGRRGSGVPYTADPSVYAAVLRGPLYRPGHSHIHGADIGKGADHDDMGRGQEPHPRRTW